MIWIATLCLLAVAAWLIFNGLNERRWVEAHSHDETVAADRGIFPDVSKYAEKVRARHDGKVSIDEEDTYFARTVAKVREKTASVSGMVEEQASKARARADEDTYFGRAVSAVGGAAGKLDDKLDARAKRARERRPAESADGKGSYFDRAVSTVGGAAGRLEDKLGARAKRAAESSDDDTLIEKQAAKLRARQDQETYFDRTVSKVGGAANKLDDKLDAHAKRAAGSRDDRRPGSGSDDGLVARAGSWLERTLGTKTMHTRPTDESGGSSES